MLTVRPPVNSRLLVDNIGGIQKLHPNFRLHGGGVGVPKVFQGATECVCPCVYVFNKLYVQMWLGCRAH